MEESRFGSVLIRPATRELLIDGLAATLGARAFDVLCVLVEQRHRVVPKNELIDRVWQHLVVEENNLQTQVWTLRKLLGAKAITTVPGCGYRFTLTQTLETTEVNIPAIERPPEPPAAAAAAVAPGHQTNLRSDAELLCGRDADVTTLDGWARTHRLITLVGPGGMGKTSLADAVARRQVARCTNGVWWVNLSALGSGAQIPLAIAQVTGVQLTDETSVAALVAALKPRQVLLVLDNCEHLLDPVTQVVQALLAEAPGISILATSQERLKLPGEYVYRLEPLAIPPAGTPIDDAHSFGAFELMMQRACAVDHRYKLPPAHVEAAISLCRQLDGIPLAIEMAAARLPLLGLPALMNDLGRSLRLLRQTNRHAPARQRTLLATLEWSHSLLTPPEQAVLACLSTFAGSFALEPAVQVAMASGLADWEVLEALSSLVDRSLLQVERRDTPRYLLLNSTRLFAAERLDSSGRAADARRQHTHAMQLLADELDTSYWYTPDDLWLDEYQPSYADLLVAYERCVHEGQPEAAAPLFDALFRLDELQAMLPSIRARGSSARGLLPLATGDARARLLVRLACPTVASVEGFDRLQAMQCAVDHFSAQRNAWRTHEALLFLANLHADAGDGDLARQAADQARVLQDAAWPARKRWLVAMFEGRVYAVLGDSSAYRACCRRQHDLAVQAGSPCQAVNARLGLADAALIAGDWPEATSAGRQALAELRTLNLPSLTATALINLVTAYLRQDDIEAACGMARAALLPAWQHELSGYFTAHAALLATRLGWREEAVWLLVYTENWCLANQLVLEFNEMASTRLASAALQSLLTPRQMDAARQAGADKSAADILAVLQRMIDTAMVTSA